MKRCAVYLGGFLLSAIAGLISCSPAKIETEIPQRLRVDMLQDSTRCKVLDVEMPCSVVPTYLRDKLKLPPGYQVGVRALGEPDYEPVMALFNALSSAGYRFETALVLTRPGSEE
jgi:hypothetical protein